MQPPKISKELEKHLFDLTLALYRVTDFFPPGEMLRRHLREKANEVFSQVLEYSYTDSSESAILKILGRLQSLKGYLEIARSMQIVRPINLFVLGREYSSFATFFDNELKSLSRAGEDRSISSDGSILEQKKNYSKNKPVVDGGIILKKEEGMLEKQWVNHGKGAEELYKFADGESPHRDSSFLLNERQGVILEHLKQAKQAKISDFYSFFNDMSSKTIQRDLQDLVAKNLLKKEGEKRWTVYTLN